MKTLIAIMLLISALSPSKAIAWEDFCVKVCNDEAEQNCAKVRFHDNWFGDDTYSSDSGDSGTCRIAGTGGNLIGSYASNEGAGSGTFTTVNGRGTWSGPNGSGGTIRIVPCEKGGVVRLLFE